MKYAHFEQLTEVQRVKSILSLVHTGPKCELEVMKSHLCSDFFDFSPQIFIIFLPKFLISKHFRKTMSYTFW